MARSCLLTHVLLKRLVDSGAFSRANAISAFEACGIYPVNRQKITDEKLSTSVPFVNLDGPANSNGMTVQNTVSDSSVMVPAATSSSQPLSPCKGIKTAVLSQLQQITPTGVSEKRVRIRQTLAECLTSDEASRCLKEDEQRKKMKGKTVPVKAIRTHKLSARSQKKPASRELQNKFQRRHRPVFLSQVSHSSQFANQTV